VGGVEEDNAKEEEEEEEEEVTREGFGRGGGATLAIFSPLSFSNL
jgi:hypothetical protein